VGHIGAASKPSGQLLRGSDDHTRDEMQDLQPATQHCSREIRSERIKIAETRLKSDG
jgi:hypothetical protein